MGKRRTQQQIKRHWLKPCLKHLQGNGLEPDPDDLRLIKLISEQLENGDSDIVVALAKIATHQIVSNKQPC